MIVDMVWIYQDLKALIFTEVADSTGAHNPQISRRDFQQSDNLPGYIFSFILNSLSCLVAQIRSDIPCLLSNSKSQQMNRKPRHYENHYLTKT